MLDVFFQDLLARPPYFSAATDALDLWESRFLIKQSQVQENKVLSTVLLLCMRSVGYCLVYWPNDD